MSGQEDGEVSDSSSDLSQQDIDNEQQSVSNEIERSEQDHLDGNHGSYATSRRNASVTSKFSHGSFGGFCSLNSNEWLLIVLPCCIREKWGLFRITYRSQSTQPLKTIGE